MNNNNNTRHTIHLAAGTSVTTENKVNLKKAGFFLSRGSYDKDKNTLSIVYKDLNKPIDLDLNLIKRLDKDVYSDIKKWIKHPERKLSNKSKDLIKTVSAKKRLNYEKNNPISELFGELEAAVNQKDGTKVYKYNGCNYQCNGFFQQSGTFGYGVKKQAKLIYKDIIKNLLLTKEGDFYYPTLIGHSRGCFATLEACRMVQQYLNKHPEYKNRIKLNVILHDPVSGNLQNTTRFTGNLTLTKTYRDMTDVTCIDNVHIVLQSTGTKPINGSAFSHNHGYAALNKCFSAFIPQFSPTANQSISVAMGEHGALQEKPVDKDGQMDIHHPKYHQYKKYVYFMLQSIQKTGVSMNGEVDKEQCDKELNAMTDNIQKIVIKNQYYDFRKIHGKGMIFRLKGSDQQGIFNYIPIVIYHANCRKNIADLTKDLQKCGETLTKLLGQRMESRYIKSLLSNPTIATDQLDELLEEIKISYPNNSNMVNCCDIMQKINQTIQLENKLLPLRDGINRIYKNKEATEIIMTKVLQKGYLEIAAGKSADAIDIDALLNDAKKNYNNRDPMYTYCQTMRNLYQNIEFDRAMQPWKQTIEALPPALQRPVKNIWSQLNQAGHRAIGKGASASKMQQSAIKEVINQTTQLLEKYQANALSEKDIQHYKSTVKKICHKDKNIDSTSEDSIINSCDNLSKAIVSQINNPLSFFNMNNIKPCNDHSNPINDNSKVDIIADKDAMNDNSTSMKLQLS